MGKRLEVRLPEDRHRAYSIYKSFEDDVEVTVHGDGTIHFWKDHEHFTIRPDGKDLKVKA